MLRYQEPVAAGGYGAHKQPRVMYYFWLWTPCPPEHAANYKFEVTLWNINEHSRHSPDVSAGRAQSLQHSVELILNPANRKNIASFPVRKKRTNGTCVQMKREEEKKMTSNHFLVFSPVFPKEARIHNNIQSNGLMRFEVRVKKCSRYGAGH